MSWWSKASTAPAPLYYLMRGTDYLHWSGLCFTDKEVGAWLGTAAHLTAFRARHRGANAPGISVITHVPQDQFHLDEREGAA